MGTPDQRQSDKKLPPYSVSDNVEDEAAPPPYEPWLAVPDTSLLPPPPSITYHTSPRFNATRDAAVRAHQWTDLNPLWPPRELSDHERRGLPIGYTGLIKPHEMRGALQPNRSKPGIWSVHTAKGSEDSCLLSSTPLYSALLGASNPSQAHDNATIAYFEIEIHVLGEDAGIALGFIAPPYPTWRLPGWERASLGVHSDDGRRYINDSYGGQDFTDPFLAEETIGIGMEFGGLLYPHNPDLKLPHPDTLRGETQRRVTVFMTRNGERRREWQWDLHEEVDARELEQKRPGGVTGLSGGRDLHAAVGCFGAVRANIKFGRHNWLWKP